MTHPESSLSSIGGLFVAGEARGNDDSVANWRRAGSWALAALLPRLAYALLSAPIFDEAAWGALASSLLHSPTTWPMRGFHHPVLPVFLLAFGRLLFGSTVLGARVVPMLAGAAAVGLVWRTVRATAGPRAAEWAAFLLTWNEFHLGISAKGTEYSFYFFFLALAFDLSARYLRDEKARTALAAGAAFGAAAFCREDALLSFILVMAALAARRRIGWRRMAGACGLFLLVCSPDLLWNAMRFVGGPDPNIADYRDHLSRIGGFGWSWGPLSFFLHSLASRAGWAIPPSVTEYPAMNAISGLLLLFAAATSGLEGWAGIARLWFWGLVSFFSLIAPGTSRAPGLDPILWLWCSPALLPGIALAGAFLSRDGTIARTARVAALLAASCCAYQLASPRSDVARYRFRWSISGIGSTRAVRFEADACPVCAAVSGATVRQGYTLPGRRPLTEIPRFSRVAAGAFEAAVRVPDAASEIFLNLDLEAGPSRFANQHRFVLGDARGGAREAKGG